MSRTEGSFKISGALEPRIASALDARTLVQTKAELTASGNFPYPYVGLEVYVISENKKYRFIGSDTTDINDWEEVGSGGGSDIQVDTLPTASIDELDNIYQYIGADTQDYKNGCFYQCVSDGESTPTYSWEMKPVMPSLEASDMADIVTPLPTGGRVTGFTPIGTIIPMIAETAPLYYLKCDGATYNKSDYPELAAHLLSMTNHSMYEVSGDDTKFKVPDLRGEFLRGTGTNSHTDNGNGAAVGVHQDGTKIPQMGLQGNQANLLINYVGSSGIYPTNGDGSIQNRDGFFTSPVTKNVSATTDKVWHNIRPTNTSVLYCIATKDIYIDARNIYSTTEKVVGEWIDGSPLYQKTLQITMPSANESSISTGVENGNHARIVDGFIEQTGSSDGNYSFPVLFDSGSPLTTKVLIQVTVSGSHLYVYSNFDKTDGKTAYITIQYTKTTD